jgi:thioesterase domain-containing protein/acyl carrier protein
LSGGELEFLGRLDHQVKIRGFRVELGEIEAALEELPAVREAVVRLRPDARGEPRLVAWLVAAEGAAPVVAELRGALAERLPEYMVPAAFVTLSRLPLTPNGKLDTAALPEPGRPGSGGRAAPAIAPRDGVELELTRLWEDLLGLAEVRSDESFFELGGHSLAALRLMARIRSRFGRELPVAALFQRPTIEGLAELIRQGWVSPPSRLVPIEVEAGGRPWFCVHPVGGAVLCYAELGRCLRGRRSLYGLEAEAGDAALGDTTVAEMAAGYLRETRAVQATGPYLLAGWSMGGLVALEMAQQLAARGEAVELLALVDPTTPVGGPPAGQPGAEATVWQFAQDLAELLGADPAALAAGYAAAPAGESADAAGILERMYASLRAARLLPPDLTLPDLRRRLRVFERNLRAGGTYEPRPYAGRLALLMAAEPAAPAGTLAVWQGLAAGELSVQSFPGGHYALLRRPLVAEVASALERLVARPAQGG